MTYGKPDKQNRVFYCKSKIDLIGEFTLMVNDRIV